MEKMAEGRIRAKKDVGVKVNKALAEKIRREEEREKKKEEKKKARKALKDASGAMDVDREEEVEEAADEGDKQTLLTDPRFTQLFENPEFAVDESTREYALLNPSAVGRKMDGSKSNRTKTAVEDEEDESDKASSDGLGEDDSGSEDNASDDSSDAGGKPSYVSWKHFIFF